MNNAYPMTVLNNSLKIVSHSMKGRDSIAVGVGLKVGGRNESKRISGMSHFIEHLVFKGTKKRTAKKIKEEVEGRGGVLNGYTSEDTTFFFIKITKKHFDYALEILADMVQNPLFSMHDIERERTVILEEIKMYMDMPMHYAYDLINSLLWPNQPLGRFVAGNFNSVSRIRHRDLKKYHQYYYMPSNILVSACGDICHDDVVASVRKHFIHKNISHGRSCVSAHSSQKKPRFLFCERKIEQSNIVIGMHAVSRTNAKRYLISLLHIMLGANMSSRLYDEVREKRGLAYEIRTNTSFYEDTGSFTIAAGVENKKVEKTLSVILKELTKLTKSGIRKNELDRAKEYFINQFSFALEDTLDHMLWLGDKALYFKAIPTIEMIKKKIASVTPDDILSVARHIFKNNNLSLVVIGPLEKKQQYAIRNNFSL